MRRQHERQAAGAGPALPHAGRPRAAQHRDSTSCAKTSRSRAQIGTLFKQLEAILYPMRRRLGSGRIGLELDRRSAQSSPGETIGHIGLKGRRNARTQRCARRQAASKTVSSNLPADDWAIGCAGKCAVTIADRFNFPNCWVYDVVGSIESSGHFVEPTPAVECSFRGKSGRIHGRQLLLGFTVQIKRMIANCI